MTSVGSADINRLAEALRRSGHDAEATTQRVLIESANFLLTEMEARVPVDTGDLRRSLGVRVEGNRILVGPSAPYAPYVEFGTAPHDIKPKAGHKALKFMVNGHPVYAKIVHHPGTKAQPFVRPAFEAWAASLGAVVGQANVDNILKEAG